MNYPLHLSAGCRIGAVFSAALAHDAALSAQPDWAHPQTPGANDNSHAPLITRVPFHRRTASEGRARSAGDLLIGVPVGRGPPARGLGLALPVLSHSPRRCSPSPRVPSSVFIVFHGDERRHRDGRSANPSRVRAVAVCWIPKRRAVPPLPLERAASCRRPLAGVAASVALRLLAASSTACRPVDAVAGA